MSQCTERVNVSHCILLNIQNIRNITSKSFRYELRVHFMSNRNLCTTSRF